MNYKIVIPSLSRVTILKKRTLAMLEKHNIKKSIVYIFVVEEEANDYYKELHGYNIIVGKKGISEQRTFISNYFDEDQPLISLDDDIKDIYELEGKALKPLKDLSKLFKNTLNLLDFEGCRCAGIYPVKNPFYMRNHYSINLSFCIGQVRFFLNTREIETTRLYTLLEDYETSLYYYVYNGKIVRLNNICADADYNKLSGGLSSITNRDYDIKKKEVLDFYNQYQDFCWVNDRVTSSGEKKIDIRFKSLFK